MMSMNPPPPGLIGGNSSNPSGVITGAPTLSASDATWHKLFVDNIHPDIPDDLIKKLLEVSAGDHG